MGAGESGVPFYDLSKQYQIDLRAWADPALGNTTGINVATLPTYFVLSSLQRLGIPGWFLQAGFFWIIFVAAGLSLYFLTLELFKDISKRYALLATFLYWFNLFSLVNVWNRFLNNYMVFFALL